MWFPWQTLFAAPRPKSVSSAVKDAGAAVDAKLQEAESSAIAGAKSAAAAASAGVEKAREGAVNLLEERERDQAKEQLLSLLEDEALAEEVMSPEGKPLRGRVDETLARLERSNPTPEPVYSDLLDGAWQVKLSGTYAPGLLQSPTRELALFLYAGGFSPGNALSSVSNGFWGNLLGLKAENLRVQIMGGGADVESSAEITTFGQRQTVSYRAELMPLSANRMSEEILSLNLPAPLGSQENPMPWQRQVLVTYLDDDIMIARDESGVADVLVREKAASA